MMKKFLVAALALVGFCGNAMAIDNEPESGLSYQVVLGMTTSKINGFENMNGKVGGTLGFKAEYMLPNAHGTYINAGVNWAMKGARKVYDEKGTTPVTSTSYDCKVTNKITTHYLEIPIHVGFRYNVTDEIGVYADLGPYFALGLGGKYSTKLDANGSWTKEIEYDYGIFKSNDSRANFQIPDFGFGFRIGGEYMKHYSFNISCDWGITDMWRNSYKDKMYDAGVNLDKIHNFNMALTFGYRF